MKKISLLRIAFVACTVASALLQPLAFLLSYDAGTHYFQKGAWLPVLAAALAVLGAICGTIAAFMTNPESLNASPFSKEISASPAALGFIAAALALALANLSTLSKIAAILMLLSALYEILIGHPKMQRHPLTAYLGIVGVLATILLNAVYYFDARVEMNSPIKVSVQIGLLFVMLARTCELRYLVGRPQPRMLLALSSCAASIGAIASLSLPAAFLLARTGHTNFAIPGKLLLLYAAGGFLILCASITSLLRIRNLLKAPDPAIDTENGADDANDSDGKDPT